MMTTPTLSSVVSCLTDYDPNAMSVDKAKAVIRDLIAPVRDTERLELKDALNRVLAEDIISPIDVPAHDNAAMDGYAFNSKALEEKTEITLNVRGHGVGGQPISGRRTA